MVDETTAPVEGLLPCPFCGASAHQGLTKVQHDQLHGEPFQRFEVWCPANCARINRVNRTQAVAAWNNRIRAEQPRPTEASPSLQKAQTSPDATPGKAMADDGLAGLVDRVAKAGIAERRATIEQIVHECPKLQGEPSRDCIAALSGVATSAARQAARAVIAALTGTDGVAAENEACAKVLEVQAEVIGALPGSSIHRALECAAFSIRARMGDEGWSVNYG